MIFLQVNLTNNLTASADDHPFTPRRFRRVFGKFALSLQGLSSLRRELGTPVC